MAQGSPHATSLKMSGPRRRTSTTTWRWATGSSSKFQLPELGMQCPNAQITKLKPVLVAAVASGIEHVWEADSRPSPPSRVYCAGTRCTAVRQEQASEVLDNHLVEDEESPAEVPDVRRGLREDCDRRTGTKSPHHCGMCVPLPFIVFRIHVQALSLQPPSKKAEPKQSASSSSSGGGASASQCAKRPSCLRAPERAMPLDFGDPPAHVTCPTVCPWASPAPVAVRPHGRAPLC